MNWIVWLSAADHFSSENSSVDNTIFASRKIWSWEIYSLDKRPIFLWISTRRQEKPAVSPSQFSHQYGQCAFNTKEYVRTNLWVVTPACKTFWLRGIFFTYSVHLDEDGTTVGKRILPACQNGGDFGILASADHIITEQKWIYILTNVGYYVLHITYLRTLLIMPTAQGGWQLNYKNKFRFNLKNKS